MIDRGRGQPIVMVPGMQGRWEWMEPAIDALAARYRVLSFSLNERTEKDRRHFFDDHIDRVLDTAKIDRAVLLGVSFGGLVAAHYAAHRPARVAALILVSTPPPRWQPSPAQARALRHPWLSYPLLVPAWIARLGPELAAARPTLGSRLQFMVEHGVRAVRAPLVPGRVAGWINEWLSFDMTADCTHITAPTLVITGDPGLDRVVAPAGTREYLTLIPRAQYTRFTQTGHLGLVTQPAEFTRIVSEFIDHSLAAEEPMRQRITHAS